MLLHLWVLKSSWTTPLSKAPSAPVDLGPFYCVWDLWCDRERPTALCWGLPGRGSCVCAHVHPYSSWEHWERAAGFYPLWSLSMRWGSSPGCCAALQAEPQGFWGAPAHTKHRAVCDNRKRTVDQFCQVRPSSCAQIGKMLLIWGSWCPDEALRTPYKLHPQSSPLLCWNCWGEDLEESWGSWKCWRAVWHSEKLSSSPHSLSMLSWCGNYTLHVTSTRLLHPTALLVESLSVLLSGKKEKVTALFHLP